MCIKSSEMGLGMKSLFQSTALSLSWETTWKWEGIAKYRSENGESVSWISIMCANDLGRKKVREETGGAGCSERVVLNFFHNPYAPSWHFRGHNSVSLWWDTVSFSSPRTQPDFFCLAKWKSKYIRFCLLPEPRLQEMLFTHLQGSFPQEGFIGLAQLLPPDPVG